MKIIWKKKVAEESGRKRSRTQLFSSNPNPNPNPNPNLPFETVDEENDKSGIGRDDPYSDSADREKMAEGFESQGVQFAEDGLYSEALGKWEAAIVLMPEKAKLHEQKAQVLLEIGDAWSALKAAARATELDPLWAEAWVTLGRAQLNYGEPDLAIESFDKALAIKPNHEEVIVDRETASRLIKRRKQLHAPIGERYKVQDKDADKDESSNQHKEGCHNTDS